MYVLSKKWPHPALKYLEQSFMNELNKKFFEIHQNFTKTWIDMVVAVLNIFGAEFHEWPLKNKT
jgi:hypothetical protein